MSPAEAKVGDRLPELVVDAVDAEKMKLMAALLRDPNPIHLDASSVIALGMGDRVVNQGPSNLSYLLNMVTRWAGGVPALRDVQVRFLGNVFAGDRVVCTGTVSAVGADTVSLDVGAVTESGPVLSGTIIVTR
jgi:acyl dehydratase